MKDIKAIIKEEYDSSIGKYAKEFIISVFILNTLKKYSIALDHNEFEEFKKNIILLFTSEHQIELPDDIKKLINGFRSVDTETVKRIISILNRKMKSLVADPRAIEVLAREINQWENILDEFGGKHE